MLTTTELTSKAEFLTDFEGNKKAVVIDMDTWNELLTLVSLIQQKFAANTSLIPGELLTMMKEIQEELEDERRWDELFARSPEVMERLAEEARTERKAGRTRELDPDKLWNL
jgi:hypothetical protein